MKDINTHELLLPNVHTYRLIIVTGPQRSGTTFMGEAIAHDTARAYVDERVFNYDNKALWWHLVTASAESILQCPTMFKYVHDVPDDVMVVVMRRDIDDILKSEERVGWQDNQKELKAYGLEDGHSCIRKYNWWEQHKKYGPTNYVEVEYESLQNHPLWVEGSERMNFGPKQTRK